MKKISILFLFLFLFNCRTAKYEGIVPSHGSMINLSGAKFVVEENSVADSQKIKIEKKSAPKVFNTEGYRIVGPAYSIGPETLAFDKPILFACPASKHNLKLAVKIANGFVPLAGSKVVGETLQAKIRHGGEYFLIEVPEKYGIMNALKSDQGLLVVSDLYVSRYIADFKKVLKQEGYQYPVWTFTCSGERPIEENAKLLAEELKRLHAEYGKFRLDVVSFGVGGLITHRYLTDSTLYGYDISSAVIAVGTPFYGSDLAEIDNIKKSRSPYRFFFLDAMADNARELASSSDVVKWNRENRGFVGWSSDNIDENKNFASLSGKIYRTGALPEETEGDLLVSWKSTQLTWIEPESFSLNHFELFGDADVQSVAARFVRLYRSFTWPRLFTEVWAGHEGLGTVNAKWEEEIKLTFRDQVDLDALLEWNANVLRSAPADAILITNGDMDTFTAWFLQQQGMRKDVIIANRSLLNLAGYIRFLQKNELPLGLDSAQVDGLTHYKDQASGKIVTISDQVIKELAGQKKRPLVFATTVYNPEEFGFHLVMNGLVYRIGQDGMNTDQTWLSVDVNACQDLVHNQFRYDKTFSVPFDSLNQTVQSIWRNYGGMMFQLAKTIMEQKKYDEALKNLAFVIEHFRGSKATIAMFYFLETEIYLAMGDKEKADRVLKTFLDLPYPTANRDDSLTLLNFYKGAAKLYGKIGEKEQAIKLLAEGLKITPDDKELIKLIQDYQGE